MSLSERLITIALCVAATQITRALPFIVFNDKRTTFPFIRYLGKLLPPAVFGILLVFCLKDVSFVSEGYGIAELVSIAVTVLLEVRFRKMLLSIAGGTAVYLAFQYLIFV